MFLQINIEVTDENDCPPVFKSNYSVDIDDITSPGTTFLEVAAFDCDTDPVNRNISYTLSGECHGKQVICRIISLRGHKQLYYPNA